jgi:hypothetical protein
MDMLHALYFVFVFRKIIYSQIKFKIKYKCRVCVRGVCMQYSFILTESAHILTERKPANMSDFFRWTTNLNLFRMYLEIKNIK